jgi:hypothetical protein
MTLVTTVSVHRIRALDLPRCPIEDRHHGLLLGQVRCGGEASFPPSRAPCAKIGLSRTARRGGNPSWACDRLRRSRTPRPEPRHAVTLDPARSRDKRAAPREGAARRPVGSTVGAASLLGGATRDPGRRGRPARPARARRPGCSGSGRGLTSHPAEMPTRRHPRRSRSAQPGRLPVVNSSRTVPARVFGRHLRGSP